ncbi:MAG: CocE/NonD family hydrolase [Candidatus Binatia bacterium]
MAEAESVSRGHQGSHQAFDVNVQREVMVPMRDGVTLATDIYFPAIADRSGRGPFPAIVERTPYDKDAPRFVRHARFFARHGYVALMQDVRGRGNSEGVWYLKSGHIC